MAWGKATVTIPHRSLESFQEIMRIAGDRLAVYMAENTDEGTIALIGELDRLREAAY